MHAPGKLILVVEDDASLRDAVCRLLHAAGYRTLSFDTPAAALCADIHQADCLLLDVHLPGLSGFELFDRVADRGRRIPALFVSAHDTQPCREQVVARQPSTFLSKPYAGNALLHAIERLMQSAS